jgi:hypothetical protein
MLTPRSIASWARDSRCFPLAALSLALAPSASAQNQTWSRPIGSDHSDAVQAAAPDAAGGVFVGGYTYGDLAAPNAGSQDVWLARFDGAGDSLWVRQFGSSGLDALFGAAPDGAGGVFVCGYMQRNLSGPTPGEIWVARYDEVGDLAWLRQFEVRPPGTWDTEQADTAASDGSDGVYVGGVTLGSLPGATDDGWLARHDGAGNRVWVRQLTHRIVDASAPDGSGGVLVTGHGGGAFGQTDPWVAHFNGAGNELWSRNPGTEEHDWLNDAAPDGSGGLYALGYSGGGFDGTRIKPRVLRYDGAGNLLWERVFGTSGDVLRLSAGAPDGTGGVYVSGETYRGPSDYDSPWLAHYDGAGNQLWLFQFAGAFPEAAAADDAGGVYLGGRTAQPVPDAWVARYEAICGPASAVVRNAGPNPASLQTSPPVLGSLFTAAVDLTSTGHSMAVVYAFDGAVDIARPGGQHVLCADLYGHGLLYRALQPGPVATFTLSLPDELALCGFRLSMQAIHLGTAVPFALSNAVDLVLGN